MHALNAVPDASVNNNNFDTTGSGALDPADLMEMIPGCNGVSQVPDLPTGLIRAVALCNPKQAP